MPLGLSGLLRMLQRRLGHGRSVPRPGLAPGALEAALAGLPYPIVTVAGDHALQRWEELRREGRGWPVVIGEDAHLIELERHLRAEPEAHQQTLREAAGLTHPEALRQFRAEEDASAAAQEAELRAQGKRLAPLPPDPGAPLGDWPSRVTPSGPLQVARGALGVPLERLHILLAPTQEGAEVPAMLGFGGWNANPPAAYHVAALRAWQRDWGAELVTLAGDVMELRVARRPQSREAALELAREHFLLCEDAIFQGHETLSKLAAQLMEDEWWYFWWD